MQGQIVIRPLTDADREAISGWRYGGDLAIYDPGNGALQLRGPDHVALASSDGTLLGYGTLGAEAQVPGGAYGSGADVVDLGMGLRPDLVGQGQGAAALLALIDEAERRLSLMQFRVTVAAVNGRATALVVRLGFRPSHEFERPTDGREFVQYEREPGSDKRAGYTLSEVESRDRDAFVALLDEYLGELSGHRERAVGATRASEYRYLDEYFGEPGRHAFLIEARSEVVGFALIRGPDSTGERWQVAEFFVRPRHRMSGIGQWAMSSIWARFPGAWELQVHARNAGAVAFWRRSVRANSQNEPKITSFDADDGRRLSFQFRVERSEGRDS